MQGNRFVKGFSVVLLLIVLYQGLLWFVTAGVESTAEARAAEKVAAMGLTETEAALIRAEMRQSYLDSISDESVFLGLTYDDLKGQQLTFGLDLRGGMSVVLQVDLYDLVVTLSGDAVNPEFTQALDKAREAQKSSQKDFVTLFGEEYAKVAPSGKLASIFAPERKLEGRGINAESSNEEVLKAIRAEAGEAVKRTYNLLKERINNFGAAQKEIALDENTDRINVELPGVTNPARARRYLQTSASLEFWDVYRANDMVGSEQLMSIFARIDQKLKAKQSASGDSTKVDTSGNAGTGPLFSRLLGGGGAQIGFALASDTALVVRMISESGDLPRNIKLLWGNKHVDNKNYNFPDAARRYVLYAIDTKGKKEAPLQGDRVTSARPSSENGQNMVLIEMDQEGSRNWKKMTERNVGKEVAIVLDDKVYSAPVVNGVIAGGRTQISGDFTPAEATSLANVLSIGKMPCKAEIIEEAIVGPTLGEATIRAGFIALLAGLLTVILFMMGYYAMAGFISVFSLLFNLLIIVSTLASFGTALTLPGIAGVVLTIGMAVDANVIIFERIREELRKKLPWKEAVEKGFSQSYSSIFDANITTILVGLILFQFGLGPIKSFAVVLIVGVIASVFTAVFFSRLVFGFFEKRKLAALDANAPEPANGVVSVGSNATINVLANPNKNIIGGRKIAYLVSTVLVVASLVSIFTRGFDLGVDLQGGRSYVIELGKDVEVDALRSKIVAALDGNEQVVIKTFNDSKQARIMTAFMQNETGLEADSIVLSRIYNATKEYAGASISYSDFSRNIASPELTLKAVSKVGPSVADDINNSAYKTGGLALLAILLYIFFRFGRWQYSAGAIIALAHDVIITMGMFSLLKGLLPFALEVNQEFIAAILTVIGYSINDTVIIFDRIRETVREEENKGNSLAAMVNSAINNTLSRTFMTSFTTLLVVLLLFFFGGDGVRGFAFALLIGIGVGTYSSIFVASPLVVDLTKDASSIAEEDYIPDHVKEEREAAAAADAAAKAAEIAAQDNAPKA